MTARTKQDLRADLVEAGRREAGSAATYARDIAKALDNAADNFREVEALLLSEGVEPVDITSLARLTRTPFGSGNDWRLDRFLAALAEAKYFAGGVRALDFDEEDDDA
jgi:hypothetical protein